MTTLNDKLIEARDAFENAHTDIMEGRGQPFPESNRYVVSGLLSSFPAVGDALDITRNMGEYEHERLTGRKAFRIIYETAERQHARFQRTRLGEHENSPEHIRTFIMTLFGGMERYQIEQCYRILDAAVQKIQPDYSQDLPRRAPLTVRIQKDGFEYHRQIPGIPTRVAVAVDRQW